jgi:hypothetical protein
VTRRPALALLLLALLAASPAAAGPQPVPVEFAGPARLDGALDSASGQWALLVFRDAAPGPFPLALAAGSRVVHHVDVQVDTDAFDSTAMGWPMPERHVPEPVDGRLALAEGGWASLYLHADRIEVQAEPLAGLLAFAAAGEVVAGHLPRDVDHGTALRAAHEVPEDGAILSMRGREGADGVRVALRATGLRLLEWHNARFECSGQGCAAFEPPAGQAPAVPGVRRLDYVEVFASGGTLEASSDALLALAGGPALDLAVNGTARLPQARANAAADPAGATLGAAGTLLLEDVRPAGGGRLQATLSGAFAARIDEDAAPGLGRAAVAAAALAAVPLLAKLLLGLFARSARPPALRHPKRRLLYEIIRAEPGQSFRGLQRRTGWHNGTLSNHMARLLDARLVVSRPYRNTVRYFGSDRADGAWTATVVLGNAELRRLHGWLAAHPASPQGAVVAQGERAWGWRRSTTQDRLRALVEGRLAEAHRHGRRVLYSALPEPAAGPASPWMPRLGFASPAAPAAAAAAQSATVSPSSTGGSFLATSHTPENTSAAAGTTFQSSGVPSTR